MTSNLSKYEIYIIKPQATQNLVRNPIPYYKLDGYVGSDAQLHLDDTYTRRGPQCIRVTPFLAATGGQVVYGPLSVENGKPYVFSVDIRGVAEKEMQLGVQRHDSLITSIKKVVSFTSTGNWQRLSVSFIAKEDSSDYSVFVRVNAALTVDSFWVDGFQFEQRVEATTFTQGWMGGLGYMDTFPEYGWVGNAGNSASWRSGWTRHGGSLIRLKDYANIGSMPGLSMAPFDQITTPIVTGGALYQKHIRKTRPFNIVVQYTGETLGDIQQKRRTVLDLLRPDYTPFEQPLVLRYQGFDEDGNETSDPVDIICVFESCHTDPPTDPKSQTDVLNFTAIDGHLQGAFKNGSTLDYKINFLANYLIKQDVNGRWTDDDGNNWMAGVGTGSVRVIKEAPNGDIYVGGNFLSVSNGGTAVPNTRGIARFSKANQAWQSVGGIGLTSGYVYCMEFDAAGNLYVGGLFSNLAGIGDADNFAKYNVETDTWSALGSGINGEVLAITISPDGTIYIGGQFTSASGNSNCKHIAYWNARTTGLSIWHPLNEGLNHYVNALKFHPNGELLIGGRFTAAEGVAADMMYACRWYKGLYYNFGQFGVAPLNNDVYSIDVMPDGTIVIGGAFLDAGGSGANMIAKWNGTNWAKLGNITLSSASGIGGFIYRVYCAPDGAVYMGGYKFDTGEDQQVFMLIYKNGYYQTPEFSVDTDLVVFDNFYAFLLASDGSLYIGGDFSRVLVAPNPNELEYKITASSGSANTYPLFEIVGPGRLEAITNHSTGRSIRFNDLILLEGEKVWVHLDPVKLELTSSWSGRGSVWKYLNAGSDIGDWYMRPGTNFIGVFIPSEFDTDKTHVYVQWYPKYWSIEGAVHA